MSLSRTPTWIALLAVLGLTGPLSAQRIQDVARVEGVRNRSLKGFGLVMGLPGTGDSSKSTVSKRLFHSLLRNHDIEIPEEELTSKNVAVVVVTAEVSSWTKPGSDFPVEVSSIGNAKSLEGGMLLEVRLYRPGASRGSGSGAETYALAQGRVTTNGVLTSGSCKATLEGDVSFPLHDGTRETFNILLDKPDFSTAAEVALAINNYPWLRYAAPEAIPVAHARDLGSIEVRVPRKFREEKKFIEFVSRIMTDVRLDDPDAKVIIDETGPFPSVAISGRVRVKPVTLLYNGLEIRIGDNPKKRPETRVTTEGLPLLMDVIEGFEKNGLTPADTAKLIRLVDDVGALVGRLEVVKP
ncbi:MAG: flagellar basal body P-ring protein FlgI [Planctomycetota bacterium]